MYFMFYVSSSIHLDALGCIQHSQTSSMIISAHKHIPLISASVAVAETKGLDLMKISFLNSHSIILWQWTVQYNISPSL